MMMAYSRLPQLLAQQSWTVPELHRRLRQRNLDVNIKSLYRLNDSQQPLARLDLRVAGAICQLCDVSLSELVDFSAEGNKLEKLPTERQRRLDELMAKNNNGQLTRRERTELERLVEETQRITLHNARILAGQQRRLQKA